MTNSQSIQWTRIGVEATAIVVSILFAFAIDAWWDDRQDREVEIEQLARVTTELGANAEIIQRKLETIGEAANYASKFISWMGPEPEIVQRTDLLEAWTKLYSIGTFALTRDASQDYLAKGRIGTPSSANVRIAISEWYSSGDEVEKQYDLLRVAHANIGEYLSDVIPTLHLDSANSVMARHPTSDFPFDQTALLSDPRLESRLSLYLIRLEFLTTMSTDLLEGQSRLLRLVESAEL